jgi:hypothetical protein
MTDTGTVLREKEAKLEGRVKKARATLESLETELNEVKTALKVLVSMGLAEAPAALQDDGGGADALNQNQAAILAVVPEGQDDALPPKALIDKLAFRGMEMNGDYVRTVLWRLAKRGAIYNANGLYWRNKEEAPGLPPEASNSLGPVTGRREPSSSIPSEGSIPSGSTPPHTSAVEAWDDDDIPF